MPNVWSLNVDRPFYWAL